MKNKMCIYDNKMKMYFSGIFILFIIVTLLSLIILALVKLSIFDYEILFKVLFFALLFLLTITFQLPFRPKHCVNIDDENITLYYGKHINHIKQKFLLSDISNIEFHNRFFYEKIKICSLENCINIRSSEYNKADYETLKKWAKSFKNDRVQTT